MAFIFKYFTECEYFDREQIFRKFSSLQKPTSSVSFLICPIKPCYTSYITGVSLVEFAEISFHYKQRNWIHQKQEQRLLSRYLHQCISKLNRNESVVEALFIHINRPVSHFQDEKIRKRQLPQVNLCNVCICPQSNENTDDLIGHVPGRKPGGNKFKKIVV